MGNKDVILWAKLKEKPYSSGVKFKDLYSLYVLVGFELKRTKGSHHHFFHKTYGKAVTVAKYKNNEVRPGAVKEAYEIIIELELENRIK